MENGPEMRWVPEQGNLPAHKQMEARPRISDILAANPWVFRCARLGYASNGLLYVIVGSTAALEAINVARRVSGTRGALYLLIAQPFGRLAVTLVAIGLCGFILRCFVQTFVLPTDGVPPKKPLMRVLRRTGCALTGLAHFGIALTALQLTLGLTVMNPDEGTPKRDWVTLLLAWRQVEGWLTMLAGLLVVSFAVFQFYVAVKLRFAIDLQLERMDFRIKRTTLACGVVGHMGRGVAFLIMGAFLVYAGWYVEEVEATGLGDLIRMLEAQPFGVWILIAVATGLIAYGLFLLLVAWYLRRVASW
jgi:Domain of Unknown Function (DUF1206)